jgi:sarcosine oxidase subunit beta
VIGLSVAHHLARLGESDVLLLEREKLLGSGASGASAGGLRQQFAEEANVLFAMEGVRQIRSLAGETGFDPDFRAHGYLLLASSAERLAELRRNVSLQNGLGLPSEILDPEEVVRRWPVLFADDIAGAAYCGTDGYCDPHAIVMAFSETARKGGVRIESGVEVTDLLREGATVCGVRTPRGDVRCTFTVDAGGPHGGDVARMAGLTLPLTPCRRQIFATHPFPFPQDLPLVIDLENPFYFRPEGGGVILSAAEVEETRDFDLTLDEAGLPDLVERAVHRCPALAEAAIARGWAGLRTLTPDGSAILGDAPEAPGLLLAVGMSGHGITHAPAVGRALAERIVHGRTSLPLDAFRADRFAAPGPPREGPLAG